MDADTLVHTHTKLVAVLCRRMLGSGEESRDAAQAVWEQVLLSLSGFRGESSEATWIYRIAVRTLLRIRETAARENIRKLRERYNVEEIPAPAEFGSGYGMWVRETCERCMQGVLFCLSPEARLVFIFRFINQLSYGEIASILGKDEASVRQTASRSRRTVSLFLRHDCAYDRRDARCSCGMDRHIRAVNLTDEFNRLRSISGKVHTYKLAGTVLPESSYWLSYAPVFKKNQIQK